MKESLQRYNHINTGICPIHTSKRERTRALKYYFRALGNVTCLGHADFWIKSWEMHGSVGCTVNYIRIYSRGNITSNEPFSSVGIYWDKLSPEKLGQIRILRELKGRIEQETGKEQTCGPSEKLPPMAKRRR